MFIASLFMKKRHKSLRKHPVQKLWDDLLFSLKLLYYHDFYNCTLLLLLPVLLIILLSSLLLLLLLTEIVAAVAIAACRSRVLEKKKRKRYSNHRRHHRHRRHQCRRRRYANYNNKIRLSPTQCTICSIYLLLPSKSSSKIYKNIVIVTYRASRITKPSFLKLAVFLSAHSYRLHKRFHMFRRSTSSRFVRFLSC